MSKVKTPPEKKSNSLKHDRRNTYGERGAESRKAIARGKKRNSREARRTVKQVLVEVKGTTDEATADVVQTEATEKRHPSFRKCADEPLGVVIGRKHARREKNEGTAEPEPIGQWKPRRYSQAVGGIRK
jgi:hypothetical protein